MYRYSDMACFSHKHQEMTSFENLMLLLIEKLVEKQTVECCTARQLEIQLIGWYID
jgi:hypothetical protein